MIKNLFCFVLTIVFISIHLHANAQINLPNQWNSWINDPAKNIVSIDTFRVQSFESEARDTWDYTLIAEDGSPKDASAAGISGQHGSKSLWLPAGSSIRFGSLNLSGYTTPQTRIFYAGKELVAGQNLRYSSIQDNVPKDGLIKEITAPTSDAIFKTGVLTKTSSLTLSVDKSTSAQGGYYIDNIYIYGTIPTYSLFTGTGNWNDSIRWSNLPPARRRSALIAGDITVQNQQQVKGLAVGNGSLTISNGSQLTVDSTFTLYHTDQAKSEFINKGSILAREKIQLVTSFAEKGKWSFISFPFDVYTKGIDSRFILKDDQTVQSGNYLYIQQYDGEQRATKGNDTNNWKPLPASLGVGDQLVFEKNKGYLIALDAAASDTTLTFSSQVNGVTADFGKEAHVSVPHYNYNGSSTSEHSGWYLCGNPFPGPLYLNQIPMNSPLGNFIYWYNGSTYEVFDVGSTQSIPAYGAFFFKTTDTGNFSTSSSSNSPELKSVDSAENFSSIVVSLQNETYKDHTELRFRPDASAEIDVDFDAYKLTSLRTNVPQIGSYTSSGKLLAINAQPLSVDALHIPLFIQTPVSGSYTLTFKTESFTDPDYAVKLFDKQNGQVTEGSDNSPYSFTASSTDTPDRFELVIQRTLPTGVVQINEPSFQVQGKSIAVTNLPINGMVTVMLLTGQRVWQQQVLPGSSRISLPLNRGTYIVQLRAGRFLDQQLFIIAQ